MNDRFYIGIIIRRIEKKLNWNSVSTWTDSEFKKLSLHIYEETSISISPQTLKRLFGKVKYKNDYTAQPATKEALARYLSYKDWDSFVKDQSHSTSKYLHLITGSIHNKVFRSSFIIIVSGVIFIVFAVLLYPYTEINTAVLKAGNVTGVVPHTVSFHLNLSKIRSKDVRIDFDQNEAEDQYKGELLDKNLKLINHCFESPGYFNVKLSAKGKVIGSAKVHVLSEGWTSYFFNNDNFIQRKFIFGLENRVKGTVNDGMLYISPADLNKAGFNGNNVYYLEHMLYKDFHVSADSCILEVRYRNSSEIGGISCYDVEFRIIGETGMASVILVQKGCYRWSEITIGEKYLNGKYNDLSYLSADLLSWNTMKIQLNQNNAYIINNSDTIFTTSYKQLIGQIKGIRFVTKGSGAFDYVRLFNSRNELLFDDNFGK